jgi:uncharacterized protein YggE
MEQNKKILWFFSFVLFSITIFVVSVQSIRGQNIMLPDEKPSLSVVGEAENEIPADEAKISVAIENTASDANIASKTNAEKMDKLISSLKTAGLTNKNMSTTNYEIKPNYDNANDNYDKIISYTATNKMLVTTSVHANISFYVDLAVKNGANRVEQIEFTSSKKVLNENFNELLKEAFINGKQKAEALSATAGFIVSGVKRIDITAGDGFAPQSFKIGQNNLDTQRTPTTIIPKDNRMTVTLPITFFIENQISRHALD